MAKRLVRAKHKIRTAGVPFAMPTSSPDGSCPCSPSST